MIRQSGNDHLTLLEKVLADTKPTRTNFLLARAFLLKHYGVARKQTIDSLARILDLARDEGFDPYYLEESERA